MATPTHPAHPCVSRESASESSPFLGIPGCTVTVQAPDPGLAPIQGSGRRGSIPPLTPQQCDQAQAIIDAALERDPELAKRWYAQCQRQAPARAVTVNPPGRRCPDEGKAA